MDLYGAFEISNIKITSNRTMKVIYRDIIVISCCFRFSVGRVVLFDINRKNSIQNYINLCNYPAKIPEFANNQRKTKHSDNANSTLFL